MSGANRSTQESKAAGRARDVIPTRQLPPKQTAGSATAERVLALQHTAGNQAVNSLLRSSRSKRSADGRELTGSVEFQLPQRAAQRAAAPPSQDTLHRDWQMLGPRKQAYALQSAAAAALQPLQKNVDGGQGQKNGRVVEQAPGGGSAPAPAPTAPAPSAPPAVAKKAGVDSFTVKWKKNASASATVASLRLDYAAKFKSDAAHDPALAEFRQSVMTKYSISAGPGKGQKGDTSPMHDDHYSRADDTAGHSLSDTAFESNDNPGVDPIDATDNLDYAFTAEQTIIDTSKSSAVIARRGPHTGTIRGVDPRAYGGVPTTLS